NTAYRSTHPTRRCRHPIQNSLLSRCLHCCGSSVTLGNGSASPTGLKHRQVREDGWSCGPSQSTTKALIMETNTTTLYSLAAIYIALTEAITATFGRSVEPLANRLIGDMLTEMPPEAAEVSP